MTDPILFPRPFPHRCPDQRPVALRLVTGPDDSLLVLGTRPAPVRRDPARRETCVAVLHRSHGWWTHIYAVVESTGPERCPVRLLRVLAGDRLAEAVAWAAQWTHPVPEAAAE
ncbi:hypothetical protein [Arenibaculum pallidiluteum]|uniref:hypothetical protein n=1 Tax=Arenibaculum pallidiluteum TaxID=2812559 RepID=UPI001A968BB1|nr:hypothetical protein [Arenibaculum pallidiluteum]